jgi:hypothetical protein
LVVGEWSKNDGRRVSVGRVSVGGETGAATGKETASDTGKRKRSISLQSQSTRVRCGAIVEVKKRKTKARAVTKTH